MRMIDKIALLLCLLSTVFSYKILVFSPATSKSHLISNARVADELARAGHDVTLLEIDFLKISNTTKTAKVAKKRIIGGLENGWRFKEVLTSFSEGVMEEGNIIKDFRGLYKYQQVYNDLCAEILARDDLFIELKSENFDAFFAEQINLCGFGYAHALGIPRRFLVSSCAFFPQQYDFVGLQMPISTVPFSYDMSPSPTYFERANNLFISIITTMLYRVVDIELTQVFRQKFGDNFPKIYDIVREVDITFLATDELIEISSPTLQNIVQIGGLGIDEDTKGLDESFAREMEKGKNGVIYFSLGTIANTTTIPKKVMQSFLETVKRFSDYHFIVRADKYDKNTFEYAKDISNVYISDWLPQPAILSHPRLKMFITHAGYNGIIESARSGVPLITIPFMFDQNLNSRAIEKKGWGVRRVRQQLLNEPEAIEEAIHEVLNNPSYTKQAHRIRDLIRSKPQSARERFIKTTEWVIKNGGVPELKLEGRALNTFQFYHLDILIPFVLLPILIFISFISKFYALSCVGHMKKDKIKSD